MEIDPSTSPLPKNYKPVKKDTSIPIQPPQAKKIDPTTSRKVNKLTPHPEEASPPSPIKKVEPSPAIYKKLPPIPKPAKQGTPAPPMGVRPGEIEPQAHTRPLPTPPGKKQPPPVPPHPKTAAPTTPPPVTSEPPRKAPPLTPIRAQLQPSPGSAPPRRAPPPAPKAAQLQPTSQANMQSAPPRRAPPSTPGQAQLKSPTQEQSKLSALKTELEKILTQDKPFDKREYREVIEKSLTSLNYEISLLQDPIPLAAMDAALDFLNLIYSNPSLKNSAPQQLLSSFEKTFAQRIARSCMLLVESITENKILTPAEQVKLDHYQQAVATIDRHKKLKNLSRLIKSKSDFKASLASIKNAHTVIKNEEAKAQAAKTIAQDLTRVVKEMKTYMEALKDPEFLKIFTDQKDQQFVQKFSTQYAKCVEQLKTADDQLQAVLSKYGNPPNLAKLSVEELDKCIEEVSKALRQSFVPILPTLKGILFYHPRFVGLTTREQFKNKGISNQGPFYRSAMKKWWNTQLSPQIRDQIKSTKKNSLFGDMSITYLFSPSTLVTDYMSNYAKPLYELKKHLRPDSPASQELQQTLSQIENSFSGKPVFY